MDFCETAELESELLNRKVVRKISEMTAIAPITMDNCVGVGFRTVRADL